MTDTCIRTPQLMFAILHEVCYMYQACGKGHHSVSKDMS